eukprot:TRINITY_DN1715_c0_g1_i3.p1 TRINITY_DN1715_c0_g1~~TRINITY_DN1715_c0_g1_i3.p1  ORF type:complete len:716 (-),score=163.09 TRINITY_DN1715_c0_g1_i3:75-2132(-)
MGWELPPAKPRRLPGSRCPGTNAAGGGRRRKLCTRLTSMEVELPPSPSVARRRRWTCARRGRCRLLRLMLQSQFLQRHGPRPCLPLRHGCSAGSPSGFPTAQLRDPQQIRLAEQSQQQQPSQPKMPSGPPPGARASQTTPPGDSLVQILSKQDPALATQLQQAMERYMDLHKALLRGEEVTSTRDQLSSDAGLPGQPAADTATQVCKPASPQAERQEVVKAPPAFDDADEKASAPRPQQQQQLTGALTTQEGEAKTSAWQPQDVHWSQEERAACAAGIQLPGGNLPGRGVQRFLQDVLTNTSTPEPWVRVRSSAGKIFFADKTTRQTRWQHPMLPGLQQLGQACAESLHLDGDELVLSLSRFGEDWLREANAEVSKWKTTPAREGRSEYYYHSETLETSWVNPRNSVVALLEVQQENLQRLRDPEYLAELRYLETGVAAAISAPDQKANRTSDDESTLDTSNGDGPGPGTPTNVGKRTRMEAAIELLADSDDGSPDKASPQQDDAAGQTEAAAARQAERVSNEGVGDEGGGSEDVMKEQLLAVLLSRRVDTTRQPDKTGTPSGEADCADGAEEEEECIESCPFAIAPSEHAQADDRDEDDPPVLATCGRLENPDASVADSMVRQLREQTISRDKLHALLCGLGLGEAEALQTLSAMAEQEWASEKVIDCAQFVAWVMESQDAVAG